MSALPSQDTPATQGQRAVLRLRLNKLPGDLLEEATASWPYNIPPIGDSRFSKSHVAEIDELLARFEQRAKSRSQRIAKVCREIAPPERFTDDHVREAVVRQATFGRAVSGRAALDADMPAIYGVVKGLREGRLALEPSDFRLVVVDVASVVAQAEHELATINAPTAVERLAAGGDAEDGHDRLERLWSTPPSPPPGRGGPGLVVRVLRVLRRWWRG